MIATIKRPSGPGDLVEVGIEDKRVAIILQTLAFLYPRPSTALCFENPFELLVAVILSAQCTDKRVNEVTARLFSKYPTPASMANCQPEELAEEIRSCGLHHNKSRHLLATCRQLVERYGAQVPDRFEELVSLPGVGRKSANVILANAFGQDALAVDTHVFRLAHRLRLATARTPEGVEKELGRLVPRLLWRDTHHWLILHGRRVCRARHPLCNTCALAPHCSGQEA